MTLPGNRKNGFLSVAYQLKYIDLDQAWQIVEWKEGHDRRHPEALVPSGEVGITLGFLTQEHVDEILDEQQKYKTAHIQIHDVLRAKQVRRSEDRFDVVRKSILITFGIALVIVGAYFQTVTALLNLVHTWLLCQGLLEVAHPLWTRSRFDWRNLVYRLAPIGAVVGWAYALYFAAAIKAAAGQAAPAESAWRWTVICLIGTAICSAVTFLRNEWRRRRLEYVEIRGIMMADLVRLATEAMSPNGSTDAAVTKILKRTVAVVSLNPWDPSDQLGGMIAALLRRPFGKTCIWFHELATDGKSLRIREFQAVNPSEDVLDALRKIKENYSAPMHDNEWYESVKSECEDENGRIDISKFLSHTERRQKTSLAGYVVARKTSLGSQSNASLFFNDSYKDCLSNPTEPVRAWINVKSSSAACVVDPLTTNREALGAIILWKSSINGVTRDDDRCLVIASKLLGAVLSQGKVQSARA